MLVQDVCTHIPALDTWVPVLLATFILSTIYVAVVVAWALTQIFKQAAFTMWGGWIRENAGDTHNRDHEEAYRFED